MQIQGLTRQLIIQDLIMIGSVSGTMDVSDFVRYIFPKASDMPTTDHRFGMETAIDDIRQHMDNNDDWSFEYLFFDYLGLLKVEDSDFMYFLEQYVHPTIRRYKWNQETRERENFGNEICIEAINKYLTGDGFELRQADSIANLPIYKVIDRDSGVKGEIKNIIFSSKYKPDIVFKNALSNDIEIVGNADQCLVYDRPVTIEGISWSALQKWYDEKKFVSEKGMVMKDFLRQSLGSRIEERFFDAYVELANSYDGRVPALLPQVWLYYDPIIERERIRRIFEHQRMDFLMLISDSKRIVIELDGIQHYGEKKEICGRKYPDYLASVEKYAGMVSAQREMTLAGYEVYRFGGKELYDDAETPRIVTQFFKSLFDKHSVAL